MEQLVLLGTFGISGITDIRIKKVPLILILISGITGMVFHIINGRMSIEDVLIGMIPGIGVICISVATKQKIGLGDAVLVLVEGIYLGCWPTMVLLWVSTMLCGVLGIFFITFLGKKRDYEMPFAPFMAVALFVYLAVNGFSLPG